MSSSASPFGLRPIYSATGTVRPMSGQIKSGYGTDIYQYQPVRYGLSGDSGSVEGYIVPAAAGDRLTGCFMGIEWVDTTGRQRISNYYPASTTFLTGTTSVVYFTADPYITYEIQGNAPLNIANIGNQYNINSATGTTPIGLSTTALDVSSAASNAQLRVIGLSNYIDNAWGDAYTIVQVQISQHQNVANQTAY